MSSIESTQVTLAIVPEDFRYEDPGSGVLITGKKILKQLEANRVWLRDGKGKQYIGRQFDGREFMFYPGQSITVPKSVAHALIQSSVVVIGDKKDFLTNPAIPFLYIVGEREIDAVDAAPKYLCEQCSDGKDYGTPQRLARHYMKDHPHAAEPLEADTVEAE